MAKAATLSLLLALTSHVTAASWTSVGPAPVINGGDEGITSPEGNNPIAGSINSFAPSPTDANVLYVAAVNGGVWKTINAKAASPNWTALTDSALPSLSLSAMALSPLDANVIFVGAGRSSSLASTGGSRFGIGRSIDGGVTWTVVGTNLADRDVRGIVPTRTMENGGQVVVVLAAGGIFRSTDGGVTYTALTNGIPSQDLTDLAGDPGVTTRLYAGGAGKVYKSDDTGASWTEVSTGTGFAVVAGSRVLLAVHHSVGNDIVYAEVIQTGALVNVYRSADQGATWTALGKPTPALFPGTSPQGDTQGAMVADKTDPNIVWLSGDRQPDQTEDGSGGTGQFPNVLGANNYSGNIWRNATGTWESMAANGANGTSPHADSRAMLFDADGNILHSCDGGIFKLNNPNGTSPLDKSGTRKWSSVNGDLRTLESHNAVYDPVSRVFLCGAQDNGVNFQQSTGNKVWSQDISGDGGRVEVDTDQTAHAGTSVRYGSSQNFGGFNRRSYNASNGQVGNYTPVKLMITAGMGAGQLLTVFDKVLFLQPFVLNQVNPTRMLIGTEYIYESTDMGDSLTNLGLAAPAAVQSSSTHSGRRLISYPINSRERTVAPIVPPVAVRSLDDEEPPPGPGVPVGDDVNTGSAAMAYGGRFQGTASPDVFYVGAGNKVVHRVTLGGAISTLTSYPGDVVRVLVMDPQNYKRVFVLDKIGKVYLTSDEGVTWSNITANLGTLTMDVRTIEIFNPDQTFQKAVLYAGGLGGVWKMANPSATATWASESGGLPSAVLVYDLRFEYSTNTLCAATLGRGVYALGAGPTVLANISTRLPVQTGDNVLIGGFIVGGTQPKRVIVRAIGPSLPLAGKLADPTLELNGPNGMISSNDNWRTGGQEAEIIASTVPPPNDLESAIVATLPANNTGYTAMVRGANGGTGIGVVEIYDLDIRVDSALVNISSRGFVQTNDNVMIGGFIIVGSTTKKVIVRAIGPSLPVPGALADPTLDLVDQNGVIIRSNDNWRTGGQEAEIIASTVPPTSDLESAIVATLSPAPVTAIVRGVGGATGVAVVEVYALN